MTNRIAWSLALALLVAAPRFLLAAALEPVEGSVSGQLVVDGKTTPLVHAYARAQRDMLDATKQRVVVVELKDDKSVFSGGILHDAFAATESFCGRGTHVYVPKSFDDKLVEGSLGTQKPDTLENKKFEYEATFRAPVWHRPAPSWTGAEAAASAPGKAVLAFLKALASGDEVAVKKAFIQEAEAAKAMDGPQAKEVLGMLRSFNPKPAAAKIEKVLVLGNGAEVTVSGPKGADEAVSRTVILSFVGNHWRVAQEMTDAWF